MIKSKQISLVLINQQKSEKKVKKIPRYKQKINKNKI